MTSSHESREASREAAYRRSDADANLFNLKCLAVLSLFTAASSILNELGVFRVEKVVMVPCVMIAFIAYSLPLAVYYINKLGGGESVIEKDWFHRFVISMSFIGTGVICIMLSMHVILLMAVPPLIAAQYRERKKEFIAVLILAIVLVPLGVYGGFLFGAPDRNFIKGMLTDEEALVFANRLRLLTPKRAIELFTHYMLPRMLSIVTIDVLAFGIARRNRKTFENQLALAEKVQDEMESRHEMQNHVIETLANLIETRDANTGEHIFRTRVYVGMIARAMRQEDKYKDLLTDETLDQLDSAAPLHDVGKISIPDSILLKPGKLTAEEFEVMKTHSAIGGEIIERLFKDIEDRSFLRMAEEIAAAHHERWDGTGYPKGLKGEDIPLAARIMAVADVFDALVSVRVYKKAISPEEALDIIYSESGTHFDPEIIRIVRSISKELIAGSLKPAE